MAIQTLWQNESDTAVDESAVAAHLESILRRLQLVGTLRVEITLVRDEKIKSLNHQFLGIDHSTDVLSFPSDQEGQTDEPLLGSIVISVETALKQAKEASVELIEEIKTLSGHGLLHLLGYHHR